LENTRWELAELNGKPVSPPQGKEEPYIQLNSNGKTLQGSAGCNTMSGNYQLDGNKLKFGKIATTRMDCGEPVMSVERAFLNAIKTTDSFKLSGGKLELYGGGKLLARFEARPPE
jgi:heat shock protein HslJ